MSRYTHCALCALALTIPLLSGSCSKEEDLDHEMAHFVEAYADLVFANYEDAHDAAVALKAAVDAFAAAPSAALFDAAKDAWLAAREPYGQTEAFRFAGGPIDDEDGPEGLLNAWPLDEAYIDYVAGNPDAGIINDLVNYPVLDRALLESLNESGGEANISVGYHAIEFLLWGQDFSVGAPGYRPYTDFVSGGTASHPDRRLEYLQLCTDYLVDLLADLVQEWDPAQSGNYRAKLLDQDAAASVTGILTGIAVLSKSELAGERMFTALDNQDQEDEHSCFSDNTHRDIILNATGISNVINGTYRRTNGSTISGFSLIDLLEAAESNYASILTSASAQTVANCEAIGSPFDVKITEEFAGGTGPIMLAIRSLQDQGDDLSAAAVTLGLSISTNLPE